MPLVAIILAAGHGGRMGGPKARLLIDGVPLVLQHAARAREAGCTQVLVVARPDDVVWLTAEGIDAVPSRAPDQAGSLTVGLTARPDLPALLLITPVDSLPARADTIAHLFEALTDDVDAVSPVWQGHGGHPLIVRASVLAPFRAGTPLTLRDILAGLGARRLRVEVADPAVALDLDRPEDVLRLTGEPPAFL
jgi:CTP:molybdopterin cytidylyltransferase MocA